MQKYITSAKIEVEILKDINNNKDKYYVNIIDSFYFYDKLNCEYFAIIFEKLGHDLLYYIKKNKYFGIININLI